MEIIGHYSNTLSLLADLSRTLDAVATMITEEDEPAITVNAPADRFPRPVSWGLAVRSQQGPNRCLVRPYHLAQ